MGDFLQFLDALQDSVKAALIGLNPIPAILVSLFIGLVQQKAGGYFVKTLLALVPSVIIAALWPIVLGYQAIWPDVTQLETEIQIGILAVICLAIILLLSVIKLSLSLASRQLRKA